MGVTEDEAPLEEIEICNVLCVTVYFDREWLQVLSEAVCDSIHTDLIGYDLTSYTFCPVSYSILHLFSIFSQLDSKSEANN